MKLDLHVHSTLSDGVFPPPEIVDMACSAGLRVLAITDHDSIASFDLARAAVRGRDLTLIPGSEISAAWDDEELHILAYFRDAVPADVATFLAGARARRETRLAIILRRLRDRGVPLDLDDIRQVATGDSLSRAHVARVMVSRGHASSIDDAFERHLHWKHGIVPLAHASVEDVIRLVSSNGGVAVWAHPPAKELEARLDRMVGWGLKGIETFRRRTHGVRTARLVELGDSHGLYTTAGSDWHGHGGEPLTETLAFPPYRLRPFLREFGLDHLAA
ncbi:MAG: PHP domain-containing protein [Candidatus Brocadiae bacterium]|nr:PHP domain-containing protein [Candidatus Brocadiia bacterium]